MKSWILKLRNYLRFIGPGWMVSIAFLDPGNFETDIQTGAGFNYQLLWIIWWSTILALTYQILCIYLGIYANVDVAEAYRKVYPYWSSRVLWFFSEISAMSADLLDVIGFAFACLILFKIPLFAGVLLSLVSTIVVGSTQLLGKRYLEFTVMILVLFMTFCFFIQLHIIGVDGVALIKGWVIPWANASSALVIVGQLGGIVMPHNLFLQSALSKTRKVERTPEKLREAFINASIESSLPIIWSFFINLSIVALAAQTFPTAQNLGYDVPAPNIGLNDVCTLIDKVFPHSDAGCIIWGLSLLSSGMSASVTTTYAGNVILQGFWRFTIPLWVRAAIGRLISIIPGVIIAATIGEAGANTALVVASAILSLELPLLLLPLVRITSSSRFMGPYRISIRKAIFLYVELFIIFVANIYFLITSGNLVNIFSSTIGMIYFIFAIYFMFREITDQSDACFINEKEELNEIKLRKETDNNSDEKNNSEENSEEENSEEKDINNKKSNIEGYCGNCNNLILINQVNFFKFLKKKFNLFLLE